MNVKQLLDRLKDAGKREGFAFAPLGAIDDFLLPVLERPSTNANAPHIYLSSGVHGDEPAGPIALLELLRKRRLSQEIHWSILPVLNPTGLQSNTRENAQGIDLNRDYGPSPQSKEVRNHLNWLNDKSFTTAVCLHEDYETQGCYLFELKPAECVSRARSILEVMEPFTNIEKRPWIDDMPNENGLMNPPRSALDKERVDLPEALKLYFKHTPWCYTLETPSQKLITDRVSAQVAAVEAVTRIALEGGFQLP